MRLSKIIKTFLFEEENRSRLTLGTDTRLHPTENRLMLEADADGQYSTDPNLNARTWITNPQSARQWLGFEARAQHSTVEGVVVTSIGFRLSDGTDDYWWDGAAWDNAPIDGEWNTEEEIAANIATFPVADQEIQVNVNLVTTNADYTPKVEWVKVLYASDVEPFEDIVYRAVVRTLRENVRPIARHLPKMPAAGSTIDLSAKALKPDAPYKIVGIDAVFNHTTDPEHWTDIYQSFDVGTKVITFTGSQAQNDKIWIRFYYEPLVGVSTSKDFYEIDRVPALLLTSFRTGDASSGRSQDDHVANKSDGTLVKVPAPIVGDLDCTLRLVTSSAVDQMRLAGEMTRFFENNPFLTSPALDEKYRLWLIDEYIGLPSPDQGELHSGQLLFRVVGVRYPGRTPEDGYYIKKAHLTGDADIVIE